MDPKNPTKSIEDGSKHDIASHQENYLLTLPQSKLKLNIAATKKTSFCYKNITIPETRDGSISSPSLKPADNVKLLKDWFLEDIIDAPTQTPAQARRFRLFRQDRTRRFRLFRHANQPATEQEQTLHPMLELPKPALTYIIDDKDYTNPRHDLSEGDATSNCSSKQGAQDLSLTLFKLLYAKGKEPNELTRSVSLPKLA